MQVACPGQFFEHPNLHCRWVPAKWANDQLWCFQIVIALAIDLTFPNPLTDTVCPGRGCTCLHTPALLVTFALGLACLLAADLDERSFQCSWFEALWAILRVLLQSRDA